MRTIFFVLNKYKKSFGALFILLLSFCALVFLFYRYNLLINNFNFNYRNNYHLGKNKLLLIKNNLNKTPEAKKQELSEFFNNKKIKFKLKEESNKSIIMLGFACSKKEMYETFNYLYSLVIFIEKINISVREKNNEVILQIIL